MDTSTHIGPHDQRMGIELLLPPPYSDVATTIRECPGFTVEKRAKKPNSKPVIDEKAAWTAEQWREWFALEFPEIELVTHRFNWT